MDVRLEIEIGHGSFGKVYRAYSSCHKYNKSIQLSTGNTVAVKVIELDTSDLNVTDIQKEIQSMSNCASDHITRYYGSFMQKTKLWVVMDFAACGSLRTILESGFMDCFDEQSVATITRETLRGLHYLHKTAHIIHRDIKAANILLYANGSIRLCDFGISVGWVKGHSRRQTFAGSPYWMSPEILTGDGYTNKVDIWSLGITIFELLTSKPPLFELDPERALITIRKSKPARLEAHFSTNIKDFVALCLTESPEQRLDASALLQTAFIKATPIGILNLKRLATTHLININSAFVEHQITSNRGSVESGLSGMSAWDFDDTANIRNKHIRSQSSLNDLGRSLPKSRSIDLVGGGSGRDSLRIRAISKSRDEIEGSVSDSHIQRNTVELHARQSTPELPNTTSTESLERPLIEKPLFISRIHNLRSPIVVTYQVLNPNPFSNTTRTYDLIPNRGARVYNALWNKT